MRAAFSDALVRIARSDPRVVLLTGDHGYALFDEFRRVCPNQYINAGVAEQNMVGMAAGLAKAGFRPFVYGLSAFIPIRVVEQIKIDIAHDQLPVVLFGDGAGFVYSHLGTSHQSTEDISCVRAIPNLSVYSPGDRFELMACMDLAYRCMSPIYFRMGKADRGDVHHSIPQFAPGDLLQVRGGASDELLILATGAMLRTAQVIAQERFPSAAVWSVPCIKPMNVEQLVDLVHGRSAVVVMEEHSVYGGLGSLVAEILSERLPMPVLRIGVSDRFSQHCGTYDYLLREHGLDKPSIEKKIGAFLSTLKAEAN